MDAGLEGPGGLHAHGRHRGRRTGRPPARGLSTRWPRVVRLLPRQLRVPESVLQGAPWELAGFLKPSPRGLKVGFISFGQASQEGRPGPGVGGGRVTSRWEEQRTTCRRLPPGTGRAASSKRRVFLHRRGWWTLPQDAGVKTRRTRMGPGWGSREGGASRTRRFRTCELDLRTREAGPPLAS